LLKAVFKDQLINKQITLIEEVDDLIIKNYKDGYSVSLKEKSICEITKESVHSKITFVKPHL